MRAIIIAVLVIIAVGTILYGLLDPDLKQQEKANKRLKNLSQSSRTRQFDNENQKRRKQLTANLRALEGGKSKRATLAERLTQTGSALTTNHYILMSIALGVVGLALGMVFLKNIFFALCAAVVLGVGAPHWLINRMIKRRLQKFASDFPDAIDVIVRGVKSGLPLIECIKIITQESEEPIRSEIARVLDEQNMGVPLNEAFERMSRNVPIQEVRFFAICITLQQKSGGSLADSLSNLSRVLRERRKMKQRILAFSSEAKSSAMIIGCLPLALTLLLSVVAPDYIGLLFTTSTGNVVLIGSAVWMAIGIFVMRQMINFDF